MELTQLQGQQVGQKFKPIGGQINIGSASGNQIQNPGLPSNAAQVNIQNGTGSVQQMNPASPVFVNGNQIKKISPVKFGDTISVGNSNNVVLGAHPKGLKLNAKQVGEHLGGLNFSGDQIADLTNRIFDFRSNQAIHQKIFILIGVLSVLLVGIIFSYTQLMNVGDQIQKEKKILDGKLMDVNNQLEAASNILGVSLVSNNSEDLECDPEEEGCNPGGGELSSTLTSQIKDLENNISKLKTAQKKAINAMEKVANNPNKEISEAEKKKQAELKKIIEENKKNIQDEVKKQVELKKMINNDLKKLIQENQSNIKTIDNNFSKIVDDLKSDIKNFSDYKNDIKTDVKDIKSFSEDFNSEKNILVEENKIRDNKIKESQGDIENLQKKDDKIDIELKKLQEEINSFELKLKNL